MYIMIICHWAILHYKKCHSKQLQEGLMVFSDDSLHFLKIKKKFVEFTKINLVALTVDDSARNNSGWGLWRVHVIPNSNIVIRLAWSEMPVDVHVQLRPEWMFPFFQKKKISFSNMWAVYIHDIYLLNICIRKFFSFYPALKEIFNLWLCWLIWFAINCMTCVMIQHVYIYTVNSA